MQIRTTSVIALGALAAYAAAFTPATPAFTATSRVATTSLQSSLGGGFELADIEKEVRIVAVVPYVTCSRKSIVDSHACNIGWPFINHRFLAD